MDRFDLAGKPEVKCWTYHRNFMLYFKPRNQITDFNTFHFVLMICGDYRITASTINSFTGLICPHAPAPADFILTGHEGLTVVIGVSKDRSIVITGSSLDVMDGRL